jgi:hypothetical protein
MRREEATKIAHNLMVKHGLEGWRLRLTIGGVPYLGLCDSKNKVILLNAHHIDTHPEVEIVNTVKHEVAHALTPGHGHNEIWAAKAKELGCDNTMTCGMALNPTAIDAIRSGQQLEVTYEEQVIRTPKYRITTLHDKCPFCGKVAKERYSVTVKGGKETQDEFGRPTETKLITLECWHVIIRELPKQTDYSGFISNEDINNGTCLKCQHDWEGTTCKVCGAHKLYPFQIEGARFVERANGRAAIYDDTGLGKTVQALAYLKYNKDSQPFLIICKRSLVLQLAKEVIRWMGIEFLPQIILTGRDLIIPGFKSYIVTYDMLRRQKSEAWKNVGIKTVVLDEIQQIKNPDSTRTQEVRRLIQELDIQKRIPLSATPWKNRGSEYFISCNLLDPIKFNSFELFKKAHVDYYWHGNVQKEGGIRNIAHFKEITKDIIIRRERSEVMPELPSIERRIQYCEITDPDIIKTYEGEVEEFVKWWNSVVIGGEENSFTSNQNALARMNHLRHLTAIAKVGAAAEFVMDFIEGCEDEKIVVFVHHKVTGQMLVNILTQYCKDKGILPPLGMTSDLDMDKRNWAQMEFNNNKKRRIAIASTLAFGEGLNLQSCANCVMHERQWNPANEEQADEGRFIRIGQLAPKVISTYMIGILPNNVPTIDGQITGIVERKRIQYNAAMKKGLQVTFQPIDMVREVAQSIVNDYQELRKNRKR